jgi:tetratricopeptide (TPR) repeat protein
MNWHPRVLQPFWAEGFRHDKNGWQSLPPLADRIESLGVSPGGAVWALAFTYRQGDVFARLEGGSWRVYGEKEMGADHPYASRFVFDGEEIWSATDEGMLHWDGQRWKVDADQKASLVVCGNGRAWALDEKGQLSRFEGGKWTALNVAPPDEKWQEEDSGWDISALARTSDGALWLTVHKLWRFDGTAWRAVAPDGQEIEDAELLGGTNDRVWLRVGQGLQSVSMNGKAQRVYAPSEIGLEGRDGVSHMAWRDGRTYIATWNGGLLEFDGQHWQRLTPPAGSGSRISSLDVGQGGEIFAVGHLSNPYWKYARHTRWAVPLAFALVVFAIPVWLVRSFKRERLQEHQRARQALEHATGEAPERLQRAERRLEKESSWGGASATVGLTVAAMVGFSVLRFFWRGLPAWAFLVLALGLHLAHGLRRSRVKRTPKPWDPIEPGGPRYEWEGVGKGLVGSLAIFCLMNFDVFYRHVGDPIPLLLIAFWAWILYMPIWGRFVNSAMRRGDWEGALRWNRRFSVLRPEGANALRTRGLILLLAGRYGEAEGVLRRAVTASKSGFGQAIALEFLADVLMEQGRYDEAMRGFEAALHAYAGYRRPYRGMAEALLRQRRDPMRALELVESILADGGKTPGRLTNGKVLDDYWSLKAWALAELGRGGEVPAAAENAIRATNLKSATETALTYHRLGMAMQVLGNESAANDYLKRARDADPTGRRGKLAKAALNEHSVFRT